MTKFGVLLQHFGQAAGRDTVVKLAPHLEELGLDSVWVRDHLMFQPHEFEPAGTVFMEPFTTLAAVGAVTERLTLGTAAVIPFRHPLVTSQLFCGLAATAGSDRIIAGIGAGGPQKPFEATGVPYETRVLAVQELAHILRLTWSGQKVSFAGQLYQFDDILLDPHPSPDTPIWYAGSSPASVRRALEYADGWLPGRCPLSVFDTLLAQLRTGAAEQGRSFGVGIVPVVSVGRNRQEALVAVDVGALLNEARGRRLWRGPFDGPEDLAGMLIAGTVDDCVRQIGAFVERDVDHVIFDLRLRADDFIEQVTVIAQEILPQVRAMASKPGPIFGTA